MAALEDQLKEKVGVPPLALCVATALQEFEQLGLNKVIVLVIAAGSVNVNVLTAVQVLLSVTVKL